MRDRSFIRRIEGLQHEGIPFCVATIVDARGSIPQIAGARAIFTKKGLAHGTVGGGTLESMCQKKALELLDGDKAVNTHFQRYNLQKDLGMTCGGEVALYLEVHRQGVARESSTFWAGPALHEPG